MNSLQVIKVRRIQDNYYTAVITIEKKRREHSMRANRKKGNKYSQKVHHVSFSIASFLNFFFIALTTKEPVRTADFIAQPKEKRRR